MKIDAQCLTTDKKYFPRPYYTKLDMVCQEGGVLVVWSPRSSEDANI